MPNLEELLPFFQQLFVQWSELTLNNAAYAITLALLVWLVTAIGYSISIWFLKMRLLRETKAKSEAVSGLEAAQQQLQSLQEQLAANSAELEQSKQEVAASAERASGLEQKLSFSAKKLAESVAAMLEKFELLDNSPAVPAGDVSGLWQRFDTILGRVAERFLGEQQAKARLQLDVQAERSKLADKDAEIAVLQRRVDLQSQKVSELEHAANELQTLQQELETLKQRLLIAQDKHRADSVRITELEKSSPAQSAVAKQPVSVAQSQPTIQPIAAPQPIATTTEVETKPVESVESVVVAEPVASVVEPAKGIAESAAAPKLEAVAPSKPASKWKGMFGNAMEKFSKLDEKLGSPSSPKSAGESPVAEAVEMVEAAVDAVENVVAEAAEKVEAKAIEVEQAVSEAVADAKAGGFASKLGGMFGGLKKAQAATAETVVDAVDKVEDIAESLPEAVEELAETVEAAVEKQKKPGKFGGLLGKFKK